MRTIAISVTLALLPGLAFAQDEGLTATSSSAGMGAEVAALDTDFLGGHATMVGANAHFQAGSLLRLEGRYLTGSMSSDYFYTGTRTNERAHLVEGEATLGFAASNKTRLFIGGTYRGLSNPSIPDGDRLSSNLFGILGVSKQGRISSRWTVITQLAGGLLVYGQEDIEDPLLNVDDTFTRNSGWTAKASVEFGRTYELGTLSIEPFFRFYRLDQTDPENGIAVDDLNVTEGGARINYHL